MQTKYTQENCVTVGQCNNLTILIDSSHLLAQWLRVDPQNLYVRQPVTAAVPMEVERMYFGPRVEDRQLCVIKQRKFKLFIRATPSESSDEFEKAISTQYSNTLRLTYDCSLSISQAKSGTTVKIYYSKSLKY